MLSLQQHRYIHTELSQVILDDPHLLGYSRAEWSWKTESKSSGQVKTMTPPSVYMENWYTLWGASQLVSGLGAEKTWKSLRWACLVNVYGKAEKSRVWKQQRDSWGKAEIEHSWLMRVEEEREEWEKWVIALYSFPVSYSSFLYGLVVLGTLVFMRYPSIFLIYSFWVNFCPLLSLKDNGMWKMWGRTWQKWAKKWEELLRQFELASLFFN